MKVGNIRLVKSFKYYVQSISRIRPGITGKAIQKTGVLRTILIISIENSRIHLLIPIMFYPLIQFPK